MAGETNSWLGLFKPGLFNWCLVGCMWHTRFNLQHPGLHVGAILSIARAPAADTGCRLPIWLPLPVLAAGGGGVGQPALLAEPMVRVEVQEGCPHMRYNREGKVCSSGPQGLWLTLMQPARCGDPGAAALVACSPTV